MPDLPSPPVAALLLRGSGLRTVFQPIVELDTGRVVAWEALCRGPAGSALEAPDRLFAAARREGLTAELDWQARLAALAAFTGAAAPATLFVNAEPEALAAAPPRDFTALRDRLADSGVQVVLEITERALTSRPAELLHAVEAVRGWGWGIAVDDLGADRASLALLPFLAPDVVKLDLRLVQQRTTVQVAEIVNAVRAHAERSGARLLAEGIETPEHARLAEAMGASYGQGGCSDDLDLCLKARAPGCRSRAAARRPWAATRGGTSTSAGRCTAPPSRCSWR